MPQVFLISDQELSYSIARYLKFRDGIQLKSIRLPRLPKDKLTGKVQWVPQTFNALADWIEGEGRRNSDSGFGLLNSIGLVELPELCAVNQLDVIDRAKDWPAVVAMLVLAFPEIHWVFLSSCATEASTADETLFQQLHFLSAQDFLLRLDFVLSANREGFSPLFDPSGLRNQIRHQSIWRPEASYVPVRDHSAVAVDEEENYSYFNAYVAYRFGFRSNVITSHQTMIRFLGPENSTANEEPPVVSFEDVYLNFPDRRQSLSQLEVRDGSFPLLGQITNRIFVTSGHSRTEAEKKTARLNQCYLCQRTRAGHYSRFLDKPGSGVFDVWSRAGFQQRFQNNGRAPGFVWPPPLTAELSETGGTHSAPGRLLLIAERLIRRSNLVLKDAESVAEAVYGATLALDAQEYLGHRTPTTSLDAIALKHHCEVLAECMFFGVEYNLDTERRFKEIEEEMSAIGVWFRENTREVSKLNAEIGMLSDLVLTFRNYNQFSEEQAGLAKLRHLHRRLWVKRNEPEAWLVWPFRWYIDTLLGSIPLFMLALAVWVLIFGFVYSFSDVLAPERVQSEPPMLHGLEDAIAAFFGMQPPHDLFKMEAAGEGMVWVTMLIIVMGYVHLGIFVSHLYSIMSRR